MAVIVREDRQTRRSLLAFDRARIGEKGQKLAVGTVVVVPFLALLAAIWQLWERYVTWIDIALLVGLYVPIALGVTVGYHRMLTHRSFRPNRVVQFVFLVLGSMAIEGAAIGWAADHLKHHQLSDQEGDPHSPVEGFVHAHLGWLFGTNHGDPRVLCRWLLVDPVVSFVDRTFVVWVVVSFLIPFAIGGWQGVLWGGLVRMFFVHHVTWSVNSVCHTFGKRTYQTTDRSSNQWTVGVIGMGEGWHNNHHAFPRSAIHGVDRWQLDISASVIQALETLGLVRDVVRVPLEVRNRRRIGVAPITARGSAAVHQKAA